MSSDIRLQGVQGKGKIGLKPVAPAIVALVVRHVVIEVDICSLFRVWLIVCTLVAVTLMDLQPQTRCWLNERQTQVLST